ncbi:hypothetical protein V9T40_009978 [Parthenolecanium corni]|uniref:Probable RNA polymerase II nuclear localization protein SLC7A6OS n=1 Tax=Parthenolecanium corni TaxID=536013 RepID=A0AAN9Y6Z4_9HEMI
MSFLKVKRKNEEDPKEVFILASKRSKLEDASQVPVFELTNSSVQGEDIDSVINNTIKNHASIKSRTFDLEKLRSKLREDNAERARENKLKVLNHIRKLDSSSTEESIPVIDLSDDSDTDENENKYVYDLYYSSTFVDLSNPETIKDYCLREVGDELYTKEESDDEFVNDDEDDSNDENYWKNDYPDEMDEEDEDPAAFLSRQLKNTHLHSDYSLSSSEYDEDIERDYYCSSKCENDYYNEVVSDSESD